MFTVEQPTKSPGAQRIAQGPENLSIRPRGETIGSFLYIVHEYDIDINHAQVRDTGRESAPSLPRFVVPGASLMPAASGRYAIGGTFIGPMPPAG